MATSQTEAGDTGPESYEGTYHHDIGWIEAGEDPSGRVVRSDRRNGHGNSEFTAELELGGENFYLHLREFTGDVYGAVTPEREIAVTDDRYEEIDADFPNQGISDREVLGLLEEADNGYLDHHLRDETPDMWQDDAPEVGNGHGNYENESIDWDPELAENDWKMN